MQRFTLIALFFVIFGCSSQTEEAASGEVNQPNKGDSLAGVKSESSEPKVEPNDDILEILPAQNDVGLREDEISKPAELIDEDTDYKAIEWTDLMPKEDLEALLNPPSYITEAKEGSLEDQISSGLKSTLAAEIDDPYQRALSSQNVVAEYDGMAIKLAGFVVPLEFDDDNVITEFFLVPFFGACIHVPPPPPNQIIYIKYAKGFKLDALYNPIWVYGVLSASLIENDVATSVYSLEMAKHAPYRVPH